MIRSGILPQFLIISKPHAQGDRQFEALVHVGELPRLLVLLLSVRLEWQPFAVTRYACGRWLLCGTVWARDAPDILSYSSSVLNLIYAES